MRLRTLLACLSAAALPLSASLLIAANDPAIPTSNNDRITALPAPGPVVIDGSEKDWDLSGGIWSYNDPSITAKYSAWTHMMWDEKGVYLLVRFHDPSPMKNATRGKDFGNSWRADAVQARLVIDSGTPEEHQMHINLFYSSSEGRPYMLVHHGGLKNEAPYDATGPSRKDQAEKYGTTMDSFGGKIAFQPWEDGKGYNMEVFWPWSYLRTSGKPLRPGEAFTFGIEEMWGSEDGTQLTHRLADLLQNDKVNRIFFFRARDGWGTAVIGSQGSVPVAEEQEKLHAERLKRFVNFDTTGTVPIRYTLPEDREVTIAIDNEQGVRVRNLIGQYPRAKGGNTDFWDGLDDHGQPVAPGRYTAHIVDHLPFQLRVVNSVYNAAVPPWVTSSGMKTWGSNHGYPTSAATRGDITLLGFTGTEGASGIMSVDPAGRILWNDITESQDLTLNDRFAFILSRETWTKKTIIRRYDLRTGAIVLFENPDRTSETVLPVSNKDVPDMSSIAYAHGRLFAFIPGQGVFRVDPESGAVQAPVSAAGLVALTDRDDQLWGLFEDGTVATLDDSVNVSSTAFRAGGLKVPGRIAVSQDGKRFAIGDRGTNQVFLYDASGKLLRTIGEPYVSDGGMRPAGKFIDTNLISPLGLDFDSKGRLWVAEAEGTNRRVTCWTQDGVLENQFWGGSDYGAMAGFPLTFDSTRFIAHGVEFALDPSPDVMRRRTMEKPLMFHPALSKTRGLVYRYQGQEYAVSVPGYNKQEFALIARRDRNGIFQPVVRISYGSKKTPGSVWTDRNGNGVEDPGETVTGFQGARHYWSVGWFRPDLTFITPDQQVYRVKEVTASGVPVYDFNSPERLPNVFPPVMGPNASGTIVMDDAGNVSDGVHFATVDGRRGEYPNPYGRHDAPAARRGLLIAPFRANGVVEGVPGVGSMTAIGGDRGEWFLMSMDGLFLSSIFQDSKGDVTLDENYIGQESFGGFLWRDEKGRILVQCGSASYRIMELMGADSIRRSTVRVDVDAEQITRGVEERARKDSSAAEAGSLTIARVAQLPSGAPPAGTVDPLIPGAATERIQETGDPSRWFRVAMAHDGKNLGVAFQVHDANPWKNGEGRFSHAFIGGDAVDLQLDIPGRGPIRVLAAPLSVGDTVVYWQKTSTRKENPTTYVVSNNEANAQSFDVVKRLSSASVSVQKAPDAYTVLLTIPLADLGLLPAAADLKGVVGVIFSDSSGKNRTCRLYWHDRSTGLVSDVPSEAKLTPANWGVIRMEP